MSIFRSPTRDAAKIQKAIDYRVLRASWDTYVHIERENFKGKFRMATPAWHALSCIQNHNGKFSEFEPEELHLLEALTTVHEAYDKIIALLSSRRDDPTLGEFILQTHPNLYETVPPKFTSPEQIQGYLITMIQQYQTLLREYYARYGRQVESTIHKLRAQLH